MAAPAASILCARNIMPLQDPTVETAARGGHIILRGNKNTWTLLPLRYYKNVLAENGEAGSGNNCTGRFGKDIYIDVPLGTIARDEITGLKEAEILEDGQEIIWLKGGRGGLGKCPVCHTNQPGSRTCTARRTRRGRMESTGIKSTCRCWIWWDFPMPVNRPCFQ